jgi:predicted RNase H-like nuclease
MHESPATITILGIDLAWGTRMPDGLAWLSVTDNQAVLQQTALCHGDTALMQWIRQHSSTEHVFIAIDAPVICPNHTGARPLDRLTHSLFGRQHCGCYPSNTQLCARPLSIATQLQAAGYVPGWQGAARLLCEVYPHPATVRWFKLQERIPYKKGKVTERRQHFRQLQVHLEHFLQEALPELQLSQQIRTLLQQPWSKNIEDQTDAVLAALIGYWHWRHAGQRSQVLGDLTTGFLLLPAE